MKKLLFAALFIASFASTALAKDVKNKVSYRIENNFKTNFSGAQNVSWTFKSNFVKAIFDNNGEKMEAFYNLNGDIIGTSKSITLSQLPVDAKRSFAKSYSGYTVKEAIHFESSDEDAYYISAENEKQSVVLKVSNNREISIFNKDRKS